MKMLLLLVLVLCSCTSAAQAVDILPAPNKGDAVATPCDKCQELPTQTTHWQSDAVDYDVLALPPPTTLQEEEK